MARARNIKPAFFVNDDLAENNCALGRILFIGLWTIADYKGDLEWRAGRIKTQLLPYDDCDIKKLAINLDKSGFVRFYSDGDKVYLNISNFMKHQNPHKNERDGGSDIPVYSDYLRQAVDLSTLTINLDNSGLKPNQDGTNPADSLIPITDTFNLNPSLVDSDESPALVSKKKKPSAFDDMKVTYQERAFNVFWSEVEKKKVGKADALKAFLELTKNCDEETTDYALNVICHWYDLYLQEDESRLLPENKKYLKGAGAWMREKPWQADKEALAKFKAEYYGEQQ
jgi:hypothetical protein